MRFEHNLMRYIVAFIMSLCVEIAFGQDFAYPAIKGTGQTINDFLPSGWMVLDSAYGDLNKDGIKDAAVIMQLKDSTRIVNNLEDTVLTQPRILLLLFKNTANNQFSLVEQSNSFILDHDNAVMDDPYQGISIDKGVLKINFHLFYSMGSWYTTSSTYKFWFNGASFVLIGADISTIHRATLDFEDYSYNFLTRKRTYTKGNEEKGSTKTTIKTFALTPLKTLKTFKEPYSWEVETDVSL